MPVLRSGCSVACIPHQADKAPESTPAERSPNGYIRDKMMLHAIEQGGTDLLEFLAHLSLAAMRCHSASRYTCEIE